jgi:hypothetical protein
MRFLIFKLAHKCSFISRICSCLLIGSFLLVGCGKAVTTEEDDATRDDQYLRPGSVMIESEKLKDIYGPLETPVPSELRSIDGEHTFDQLAEVTIPDAVYVTKGNAANQFAYVFMNENNNAYDFYCLYKGGASTDQPAENSADEDLGQTYAFVECYDDEGDELGLEPGNQVWIDKGNSIEVHVEGADPRYNTKTITTTDVTWI